MAKLLKLRRGTTTQHGSFTGAEGEVTIDTTKDTAVVHDGSTAGGRALAREDLNNVSSSTIAGRLSNDSITPSKIGSGTLPSDVTVASANLVDGTIVNADVNASAAIAGTKISPNFGSQNIVTSGTVDGRDVSADGTKLDGIESGATADQTATEIRTLVGSASDSNVFTDADHSKLDGIESGATGDQTAAEIRAAVEAASNSNVFTDADHSKLNGIEAGATADQTAEEIQDIVGAMVSGNTESGITVTYQDSDGTLDFSVASQTDQNFTNADHSKLDGIEAGATADQTGAEIASALSGQNIYTSANIGVDSTDYLRFVNNNRMDIFLNGNNEFRFEADGDFHADGDITAFSTTVASDLRLKSDIHTINNALGIVGKLRGVSYKWLRDGRSDIGVIAQEVEEVIPEIVKTKTTLDGQEGMKTVDYGKIVGVLINAINELKEEVEELKNAKITG